MSSDTIGGFWNRTVGTALAVMLSMLPGPSAAELQPEPIGMVETLPQDYPDHWMMVQDFSFFHMFEGDLLVVDPLATTIQDQYKGAITASFLGVYEQSAARGEHYVGETFYSRGARGGERTDVVTIWSRDKLTVEAEVEVPAKRITGMPKRISSGLTPDERFMFIYNFTPAQSITVVDLEERKLAAEIATPGCGFAVPTGQRGFTSICANGSLRTTHLNADGSSAGNEQTEPLFDPDEDPIFEGAAIVGGIAYFPTFQGRVLPVDVGGRTAKGREAWWLTDESERNWRPGGMKPYATDAEGLGYFLMNPEGAEGTHKDGGSEVWVYNLAAKQRIGRIELGTWGLSLGTSGTGDNRLMAVTNANFQVDIYRIPSGEFVHALSVTPQTPFMVHGTK